MLADFISLLVLADEKMSHLPENDRPFPAFVPRGGSILQGDPGKLLQMLAIGELLNLVPQVTTLTEHSMGLLTRL